MCPRAPFQQSASRPGLSRQVCQLAFSSELQRRHSDTLLSVAVTPGMVNTNLSRFLPFWQRLVAAPLKPLLLRSPAKGAESVLYAAAAPEAEVAGKYIGDCAIVEPSPQARDPELAELLWEKSASLVDECQRAQVNGG